MKSHPRATRWIAPILGATLSMVASACSDSSGGGGVRPPGDLNFITMGASAPTLCSDSAGAWFIRDPNGQDQDISLVFPEAGSNCAGSTEDFLLLRLKKTSLLRRPDNTLIADGDSVFIYVRWVGNDSILFDLYPSGLQFDPAEPARLKIEYEQAGDDLDHDGDVDQDDDTVEHELAIWRQENPGDDYVRVGTIKNETFNEIEADLNGFSRYAIAY